MCQGNPKATLRHIRRKAARNTSSNLGTSNDATKAPGMAHMHGSVKYESGEM